MTHYLHSIPGRLRLKTPTVKKNPAEARKVEALLGNVQGIQNLQVNLMTGSVLVLYEPDARTERRILQTLQEEGYFEPAKTVTHDDVIHSALTKAGKAIGSVVVGSLEINNPGLALLAALI